MTIPGYQSFMLTMLKEYQSGEHYINRVIFESVSKKFSISESDKNLLVPSGKQSLLENRLNWAKTYLAQAGLIKSVARAEYKITKKGLSVLKNTPSVVNVQFLMQFPSFKEFVARREKAYLSNRLKKLNLSKDPPEEVFSSETPNEIVEKLVMAENLLVENKLLHKIKSNSAAFFENLTIELLLKLAMAPLKTILLEIWVKLEIMELMALFSKTL